MNKGKLLFWSITVALGGFLFGFDTAVISGAEQSIQTLWELSDTIHGFAVAIALWGTVIGALVGGIPCDLWGRRKTLFWIGVFYLISAVGSALAPEIYSFMFFRFLGGLGVGASSVAAPMYISEIAPAKSRGRLVALFQFNIVLGILIAYLTNYLIATVGLGASTWRWMLGIESIPALAFALMVLRVPRSPRWLLVKENNETEAKEVFLSLGLNESEAQAELNSIIEAKQESKAVKKQPFFSGKYRFPIMLAFLFAFFNQVSGINAIIYYAPRIFEMTGLGKSAALLSTSGVGIVNLIFTMLGLTLIDRFGRKILMIIGSLGLIGTLGLVANAFFSESFSGVPAFLFTYIAFFAMSQGAVIWVFISEIFPNEVRASGQSFGSFTHWIFAAIITNIFPPIANSLGGGPIFMFFTVMMVLQLLFVFLMMPETKGVSLEELQKKLMGKNDSVKPVPSTAK